MRVRMLLGRPSLKAMAVAACGLAIEPAAAATIGENLRHIKESTLGPLGDIFVFGAGVIGAILVIVGLFKAYQAFNDQTGRHTYGKAIGMIVIGAFLTAPLLILSTVKESAIKDSGTVITAPWER